MTDRRSFGTIYFEDGQVVHGSVVNRSDRLGDMLVRDGRISEAELRPAVDIQRDDRERKLGEILVGLGAVTRAELEEYIALQIEEAVY